MGEIEKSDEFSKASQKRATREFSTEVMAKAHHNLYQRVLDKVTR
jgi:hypothetical protein